MTYLKTMRPEEILRPMPSGLCSPIGDFHIDPTRPVERALITHGHSDHARAGHGAVLATQETLDLMRLRYGPGFAGAIQPIGYGESVTLGGARVSFHPAGHVLGSAQVSVEANGLRIVARIKIASASQNYTDLADPADLDKSFAPGRNFAVLGMVRAKKSNIAFLCKVVSERWIPRHARQISPQRACRSLIERGELLVIHRLAGKLLRFACQHVRNCGFPGHGPMLPRHLRIPRRSRPVLEYRMIDTRNLRHPTPPPSLPGHPGL
jgi:hypothetical protein